MARALLSVSNKVGIEVISRALYSAGLELVSTGGTLAAIRSSGLPVSAIEDVTGFPEMLDGRVKTLHPAIHGGILFRREMPEHQQQINDQWIEPIDVVVVNLYPFEQTVTKPGVSQAEAIENIDIGGPTLLRAAAKNFHHVVVISDPADYTDLAERLEAGGMAAIADGVRRDLAAKAFAHTAAYDAMIAGWLGEDQFPAELTLAGCRLTELRYGENPHQQAAIYRFLGTSGLHGIGGWDLLSENEMSYNNYLDATAGWSAVGEFDQPAAVIVKHNVPCGVAVSKSLTVAFNKALAGDPVSAFGGVIALNRPVTDELAVIISKRKYDVILAPGYDIAALDRLRSRKGLRILDTSRSSNSGSMDYRVIPGGILVQSSDLGRPDVNNWTTVSDRQPTVDEISQLAFAWSVVKHVKSNAIVIANGESTVGICGGQPNRVDAVRMAIQRAAERARGSVLASDAFFPFADGVEEAVSAGVTAIAQPGGSARDAETIAAANVAGAAMVFTGMRHFRH